MKKTDINQPHYFCSFSSFFSDIFFVLLLSFLPLQSMATPRYTMARPELEQEEVCSLLTEPDDTSTHFYGSPIERIPYKKDFEEAQFKKTKHVADILTNFYQIPFVAWLHNRIVTEGRQHDLESISSSLLGLAVADQGVLAFTPSIFGIQGLPLFDGVLFRNDSKLFNISLSTLDLTKSSPDKLADMKLLARKIKKVRLAKQGQLRRLYNYNNYKQILEHTLQKTNKGSFFEKALSEKNADSQAITNTLHYVGLNDESLRKVIIAIDIYSDDFINKDNTITLTQNRSGTQLFIRGQNIAEVFNIPLITRNLQGDMIIEAYLIMTNHQSAYVDKNGLTLKDI